MIEEEKLIGIVIFFFFSFLQSYFQYKLLIDKTQEYFLVGDIKHTKLIKFRLDYLIRGFKFLKPSSVTVITDKKKDSSNIENGHLMICTTAKAACDVPSNTSQLLSQAKQKSILIVKDQKDTDEDVEKRVQSLRCNSKITEALPIHEFNVHHHFTVNFSEYFNDIRNLFGRRK